MACRIRIPTERFEHGYIWLKSAAIMPVQNSKAPTLYSTHTVYVYVTLKTRPSLIRDDPHDVNLTCASDRRGRSCPCVPCVLSI